MLDETQNNTTCMKTFLQDDDYIESLVLGTPGEVFLLSDNRVYRVFKRNINYFSLQSSVRHFTYVEETAECIFELYNRKQKEKLFRTKTCVPNKYNVKFPWIHFDGREVLCLGHNKDIYLVVVLRLKNRPSELNHTCCQICTFDEFGHLTRPVLEGKDPGRSKIKICKSVLVMLESQSVSIMKGYSFDISFSYSGAIGLDPSLRFSPKDVCVDPSDNFLVIDSYDDTVHLLDSTGNFLQIILSRERGPCGIQCAVVDPTGLLWLGCEEGLVYFVDYQKCKKSTRNEQGVASKPD